MKTPLTRLLGIEVPIIQAGLDYLAGCDLCASASMAGGLGVLSTAGITADVLQDEITNIKTITSKPFGVNIKLTDPSADDFIQVCAANKVAAIICRDGNPSAYMELLAHSDVSVIPVVSSVSVAKMMESIGATAVIAQGMESGGYIGGISTMTLVPQVVDAVHIPVIAAGGISDGRGIAASLMLGAQGVLMGTRFAVAHESAAHANYKKKIISAKDMDSEVVGISLGRPMRVLKNGLTREYFKMEKAGASQEELEELIKDGVRKAVVEGDVIHGLIVAGQGSGLVKEERPCGEILVQLLEESSWLLLNGTQHTT